MRRQFRQIPPHSLLIQGLDVFNVNDKTALLWFNPKVNYSYSKMLEFVYLLWPYYYPVYQAKFFPDSMTYRQAFNLVRQVCLAHRIKFSRKKTASGRVSLYKINQYDSHSEWFVDKPFIVSFN
jgi:hypothetical protein